MVFNNVRHYFCTISSSLMILLVFASGSVHSAEPCTSSARINFLLGAPDAFSLMRGTEKLSPKPYMKLCAGDALHIADGNAKASLQLGRNKFEMLQGPIEFKIPSAEQGPGSEYGLMQVAGDMLFKQDVRMSRRAQSRSANDIMVNFPCLSDGSKCALLATIERPLGIQWQGGQAPYKVKFSDCGLKSLYKASTQEMFVQTPGLTLNPDKRYCISLKDANGVKRRVQFTAKTSGILPQFPDFSQDNWLVAEQIATLQAAFLIEQGPEWAFEAYQRLLPYVANHPPAATLAQGLANGDIGQ